MDHVDDHAYRAPAPRQPGRDHSDADEVGGADGGADRREPGHAPERERDGDEQSAGERIVDVPVPHGETVMVKLVTATSPGPESVIAQLLPDAVSDIPLPPVSDWPPPGQSTVRSKTSAPVHVAVIDRADPAAMT